MFSKVGRMRSCYHWSLRSGKKVIGWFGLIFSITGPIAAVILFPANFHILQVVCGSVLNIVFSILLIIALDKENIRLLWMWIYYRKTTIIINTIVYIILNYHYIRAESLPAILLFDFSYIISQLFNVYCIFVIKTFAVELGSKTAEQEALLKKEAKFITCNNNTIIV